MKIWKIGVLYIGLLIAMSSFAMAAPSNPLNVSVDQIFRNTNLTSSAGETIVEAQAGNVTQLTINGTSISTRWQGYFGNISGRITLDDAAGNTLYDWNAGAGFSPSGEIYAANESVSSWEQVVCVDEFSSNQTFTDLEAMYGIGAADTDGLQETFNSTADPITIGSTTLTDCYTTHTYVSDQAQTASFNQTLLLINDTSTVVFATEIDQDTVGFDGNQWDFQMIVAEDGDDTANTQYYFYVELE